jgi:NEDD4-like E3 ubiquitin-protein ligase WWP1
VELSIDSNPARKTEHQKNTYLPKWNDTFTVLVTPTSILQFRVYDHSSFRKDSLIGEQTIHLIQILQHYNGRCEHLELAMDLLYDSKSEGRQLKNGELVAVFNGLKIDMSSLPSQNENGNAQSLENFFPVSQPMRSSILNGGIRSRMRLRSSNGGPSSAASQNGSVQNGGANGGALVQVQSPSTGAVRRSGMNQWDQPPPGGVILPSGSIPGSSALQPGVPLQPGGVPKPRQQQQQQLPQQAFPMNGQPVSPQQQQPAPPPQASQIVQPMQPPQGQPNGEALPDDDDEELPNGWERRIDPYGRRYYVDHNTRST